MAAAAAAAGPAIKIVVLGNAGVGKTCLAIRWVNGTFSHEQSTVGAAYLSRAVQRDPLPAVNVVIWDTAGAERFAPLAPLYYRNAHAAILVYDVTDKASLVGIAEWKARLDHDGPPGIRLFVAGAKADLTESRKITTEEGRKVAATIGAYFFETSAKEGSAVADLFAAIVAACADEAVTPDSDSILYSSRASAHTITPASRSCCSS